MEKSASKTTVHKITELIRRRRKIFALEVGAISLQSSAEYGSEDSRKAANTAKTANTTWGKLQNAVYVENVGLTFDPMAALAAAVPKFKMLQLLEMLQLQQAYFVTFTTIDEC